MVLRSFSLVLFLKGFFYYFNCFWNKSCWINLKKSFFKLLKSTGRLHATRWHSLLHCGHSSKLKKATKSCSCYNILVICSQPSIFSSVFCDECANWTKEFNRSTTGEEVESVKIFYFIICSPIPNLLAAHAFYLEVQLSGFHWQYRDPVSSFVFVVCEGQVVESISCTEHYAHWLCKNVGCSIWIWDSSDSFKFYQLLVLQNLQQLGHFV